MKDRLKKKLQAKKIRQQSSGLNQGKNLPELYKKHFQTLNALTGEVEAKRFEDEESRKNAEISKLLDEGMENIEKLYIIIKHQIPHLFEEFKKTVFESFTPEMEQEFHERIAHLEATRLKEILEGK